MVVNALTIRTSWKSMLPHSWKYRQNPSTKKEYKNLFHAIAKCTTVPQVPTKFQKLFRKVSAVDFCIINWFQYQYTFFLFNQTEHTLWIYLLCEVQYLSVLTFILFLLFVILLIIISHKRRYYFEHLIVFIFIALYIFFKTAIIKISFCEATLPTIHW